eukprot:g18129.t1
MSQREETTPDLPDPLRLLRSPQPTEFATPDAERGYNQEEDQYEPEQTFSHEDYGTTLLGADGDKRENFWRGMGMLDAKYKWVSEFLSRLVVWTICIDIASIGVLGYHYLGVAGGAGSCPKDKSLAVWLVIGMLGSIPATMVVQKVKDLYGSFRKPLAPLPDRNKRSGMPPGKRPTKNADSESGKKKPVNAMQVEDKDLVTIDDASMGGLTQQTQDDAEMEPNTQGSTSTAASSGLPTMGDEMKWNVVLNVAEKVKLGLEKKVFAPNMVEDVVESMVKNTTGKQNRFTILDRERTCMTTSVLTLVKTLEMEEASRCSLKVDENDNDEEKNSAAVLEGKVAEFRFLVQQRMQGNSMWRAAIHQHCKEVWEDDRRNVLEVSNPDKEAILDVIDIATEAFREARRQRPEGGNGLLDTDELHEHIRKRTDRLINECKDSEAIDDLHWKPIAKRMLEHVLVAENSIVDARMCFGSLLEVDLAGVDLKKPEYKNRTDVFDKVKKADYRRVINFLMIGELEFGFAESSWRMVSNEISEDDVRAAMPNRDGQEVDEDTAAAVSDGFWEVECKGDANSTALAVRGKSVFAAPGSSALALPFKRGKKKAIEDLEKWHKLTAIEKLQMYRDTPLDDILLPTKGGDFFVLMKGCRVLEVEEVAKSVLVFRLCEVLDLNDDLALRVRGQRENRITGLIRKTPFDLEKGDFVAAVVDWTNHYKSGKAELRATSEDHMFIVRDPWRFVAHAETGAIPPKIPDIKVESSGAELVKFDEKSIFAKVQGMTEENGRTLRKEIDDGNKNNTEKMENVLNASIGPLQDKMADVVKSSEGAKSELQGISQRMKKNEEKTKKAIKKGQKRSDRMLAALMQAHKLELPDEEDSESSADSEVEEKKKTNKNGEEAAAGKTEPGDGGAGSDEKRFVYGENGELTPKKETGTETAVRGDEPGAGDALGARKKEEDNAATEPEAGKHEAGTVDAVEAEAGGDGKVKDEAARIEEQVTMKRMSISSAPKAGSALGEQGEQTAAGGVKPAGMNAEADAGGNEDGFEDSEMPEGDGVGEGDGKGKTAGEPEAKKQSLGPVPPVAAGQQQDAGQSGNGNGGHHHVVATSNQSLLATKPNGQKQGSANKSKGGKSPVVGASKGGPVNYHPIYQQQRSSASGTGAGYYQHQPTAQPYGQHQQRHNVQQIQRPGGGRGHGNYNGNGVYWDHK